MYEYRQYKYLLKVMKVKLLFEQNKKKLAE